jgi:hypothetical protein
MLILSSSHSYPFLLHKIGMEKGRHKEQKRIKEGAEEVFFLPHTETQFSLINIAFLL